MIEVIAIETGKALMKMSQNVGRDEHGGIMRKLDIFLDKTWTDFVPINCYLIKHPEGNFLVDTGDTWRNSVPGYLPRWNPFYKQVKILVAPHEEVGERLIAIGLNPSEDIGTVILTHFHHDHTGGLDHFPRSRILGSRENFNISKGLRGMMTGCLPQRWPIWFNPVLIELDGPPVGPFPSSYRVTQDGRILIVPTPGHVKGHISVIVRGEGMTWFIAGDATYSQANLLAERTDGVTNDPITALETLQRIRMFAHQEKTILLPAHDPFSIARLYNKETLV